MLSSLVHADTIAATSIGKPLSSLPFYHDGFWWGVFRTIAQSDFNIWKLDGNTWSDTLIEVHERGSDRCDAAVDNAGNRLWIYAAHGSSPRMTSATYSGGVWTIDVNKVTVPDIDGDDESCFAPARRWTPTKTIFAFDYGGTAVTVNWSIDNGATWQVGATSIVEAAEGLTKTTGVVDAIEFSWDDDNGSANYIAVAYAENGGGKFGYAYLKEGDDPSVKVNWIHVELTGSLNLSDDHITIMRDGSLTNNRLYIAAKTTEVIINASHVVFVRDNNISATITLQMEADLAWSRPLLQYNATTDILYLFTANSGSSPDVKMLSSPGALPLSFGAESIALYNGADVFDNVSGSHDPFTSTSGGIVVSGNATDDNMWMGEFVDPFIDTEPPRHDIPFELLTTGFGVPLER